MQHNTRTLLHHSTNIAGTETFVSPVCNSGHKFSQRSWHLDGNLASHKAGELHAKHALTENVHPNF